MVCYLVLIPSKKKDFAILRPTKTLTHLPKTPIFGPYRANFQTES